jgi:hypothetical protein
MVLPYDAQLGAWSLRWSQVTPIEAEFLVSHKAGHGVVYSYRLFGDRWTRVRTQETDSSVARPRSWPILQPEFTDEPDLPPFLDRARFPNSQLSWSLSGEASQEPVDNEVRHGDPNNPQQGGEDGEEAPPAEEGKYAMPFLPKVDKRFSIYNPLDHRQRLPRTPQENDFLGHRSRIIAPEDFARSNLLQLGRNIQGRYMQPEEEVEYLSQGFNAGAIAPYMQRPQYNWSQLAKASPHFRTHTLYKQAEQMAETDILQAVQTLNSAGSMNNLKKKMAQAKTALGLLNQSHSQSFRGQPIQAQNFLWVPNHISHKAQPDVWMPHPNNLDLPTKRTLPQAKVFAQVMLNAIQLGMHQRPTEKYIRWGVGQNHGLDNQAQV